MTGSLDLVDLRLLVAVDGGGSFSAAARHVGITQQAASTRLAALESRIGTGLFVRSTRGSRLTDAGRLVASWAAPVVEAADRLDAGLESLRRPDDTATLRVAASLTIAEYLVPRWLVGLRMQHGTAAAESIDLVSENSDRVMADVREGHCDLGFVETTDEVAGLESIVLAYDELVVVVAPGHPWAGRRRGISAELLAATPLVTRERGSGTRRSLELMLAGRAPALEVAPPAVELSSTAAVRAAAAAGVAPAVLSILAVRDDLTLGRLVAVRVASFRAVRPLRALWRADHPPRAAGRRLLDQALREASSDRA
jgi:DNA-binding transcriptional LysR family regulator